MSKLFSTRCKYFIKYSLTTLEDPSANLNIALRFWQSFCECVVGGGELVDIRFEEVECVVGGGSSSVPGSRR